MRKFYISLLIISILAGILVSWQLRSHMLTSAKANQDVGLIDIIRSLEKEDAALEKQIADLRKKIDDIQKENSRGKGHLAQLQKEIENLKLYAGLTPVTGPGITVVLDDNTAGAEAAKNTSPSTYKAEYFIIHDKNVLYMVNDLKAAGAEAIAVNNLRIVTNSDIRCVGTVIMINSTRVAPPYEIKAIGDPNALEIATQHSEEYIHLKSSGFPVKITKTDSMVLPAYSGGFRLEHVRPLQTGGSDNV